MKKMKKSIKKLSFEKKTISKLNDGGKQIKGGLAWTIFTCYCPRTRFLGGCSFQTN
jgi:hypothetical protein